ncbi:MAG: LysR family transcriptional regulator [Psychromonas sp.]
MNISDLNLFIRIVETGQITEAANQLGITPAAVSSALKRLEKQLDLQLVVRTTRQLRITPQGEQFLFHCRKAIDSLEQGRIAAHQMQGKISGKLRLSVSSDFGRNTVLPWLDEFLDLHPSLSIDLSVGDSLSDFFMDHVDIALRYGKPEDSTMVSFHIATMSRLTCASAAYIANFGEPLHPQDLRDHNCLLHKKNGRLFSNWQYMDNVSSYKIKVDGNRVSNDTDIVRRWAVSGKGIVYRSQIDVISDLRCGNLIEVLSSYMSPAVELHLICPSRKQVSPAVIAFREFLREKSMKMIAT